MKLDEIEKLIAAASIGPWKHENHYIFGPFDEKNVTLIADTFSIKNGREESNAEFIAASREFMPRLLKIAQLVKDRLVLVQHRSGLGDEIAQLLDELES